MGWPALFIATERQTDSTRHHDHGCLVIDMATHGLPPVRSSPEGSDPGTGLCPGRCSLQTTRPAQCSTGGRPSVSCRSCLAVVSRFSQWHPGIAEAPAAGPNWPSRRSRPDRRLFRHRPLAVGPPANGGSTGPGPMACFDHLCSVERILLRENIRGEPPAGPVPGNFRSSGRE